MCVTRLLQIAIVTVKRKYFDQYELCPAQTRRFSSVCGSSEKVRRRTRAEGEKSGEGACPLPSYGVQRCHPQKIVENRGANLCNFVHF